MEERENYEEQKDLDDHESEKEQHSIILFMPKQLEVLLKMNRPNFIGLVEALKRRSFKTARFKPIKPESFDGSKIERLWMLGLQRCKISSCCQSWVAICLTYSILFKGLCLHMVEDGEERRRE